MPQTKNRYRNAPKRKDHTIDQRWETYTREEHGRWDRLFARQMKILPGRACDIYLEALQRLELSQSGIPNFEELSDRLELITGWRVIPVADLVPDHIFFDHLANRRFPAGAFIRPEAEFDYLQEPDVFHDVFGHVPMLAVPTFAKFMEAYGKGGLRADGLGVLHHLARLYWYTVEFGLRKTEDGLRIYGAGILSSPAESKFSLEDTSPHRVKFDLMRLMRTNYIIDDYQQTYFVIDDYQQLLDDCYVDFAPAYRDVQNLSDIVPHQLVAGDKVIHEGTLTYFQSPRSAVRS